ncbi:MAG: SCP2 sterol-binding domain-containing protein [Candidatus Hodarchaeota archaeon]
MVDESLIKDLKDMREKGPGEPSDALKMYEFIKQLGQENEELKEELEDMDKLIAQMEVTDIDYKYWVSFGEGVVDYAEGVSDEASVTMKATQATWAGLASGEIDSTSAYMSGDLVIEGNLQDAIAYGEVLSLAMELGEEFLE